MVRCVNFGHKWNMQARVSSVNMFSIRVAVRSLTGRALSLTARLAERSTHSQNSERVIGERLSARSLGLRGSGRLRSLTLTFDLKNSHLSVKKGEGVTAPRDFTAAFWAPVSERALP